jgi:O-methyltransferase
MNEVSARLLSDNFRKDNITLPVIKKCWFNELTSDDVPANIAFAHLDGDLYISTIDPLKLVYDKMSPGGIILIDDYLDPEWPGVEQAIAEFFNGKPETVVSLPGLNGTISHKALIVKV